MRLTKDEICEHKLFLTHWRKPDEMKKYVHKIMGYMKGRDLFNQSGVGFIRDAWIAAQFAMSCNALFVRITHEDEQWPDFEVAFRNGAVERFESIEADIPGRKRGEEYRETSYKTDPIEDWNMRAHYIPEAIEKAFHKKVGKHYSSASQLVIYLNINEWGIGQEQAEHFFSDFFSKNRHSKGRFSAVWILWKSRLYSDLTAVW